jgi:hypothetical protein
VSDGFPDLVLTGDFSSCVFHFIFYLVNHLSCSPSLM